MDWASELPALLNVKLFTISSTVTTVGSALAVVGTIVTTYLVARLTRRLAKRRFARTGVDDEIALHTTVALLQIGVWLVGIEVVLHLLGIQLATLFATTGALALGVGFALKGVVENWIAGIILRVGQTVRPGDVILLHDRWLEVKKIGPRTTDAVTYNDEEVMIPNSVVTQSIVTNLTRHSRQFRVEVKVGVPHDSDLDLVRSTLETTVRELPWASTREAPSIFLLDFGLATANYQVNVWIDDVGQSASRGTDLNEAIWRNLKQAGITIGIPQLGVHLESPSDGKAD